MVTTIQNQTTNPYDNPDAFGPNLPNEMAVSGGPASSQFVQQSSALQNLLGTFNQANPEDQDTGDETTVDNYSDAYTQALTEQGKRGDLATKALIGSMQAQNQNIKNKLTTDYDSYKRGLQLLGIQRNSAQSTPELLMGHIKSAQDEYVAKITDLNREESLAIMEAQGARDDKNLSLLKEKMDYVKEIKKQKQDALKEAYNKMSTQADISKEQVRLYYDEMQKLNDEDKEDFLIAISKKFNVPLPSLVKAMSEETTARQDKLDKKKKEGGTGGGYTAQELRKLRQAGIDPTDITTADDFLYGGEEAGGDFFSLADRAASDPANIDDDEYITAEAFKNILAAAQQSKPKVTRQEVIDRYKDRLYLNKYKFAKNYGLSKAEFDKLTTD